MVVPRTPSLSHFPNSALSQSHIPTFPHYIHPPHERRTAPGFPREASQLAGMYFFSHSRMTFGGCPLSSIAFIALLISSGVERGIGLPPQTHASSFSVSSTTLLMFLFIGRFLSLGVCNSFYTPYTNETAKGYKELI